MVNKLDSVTGLLVPMLPDPWAPVSTLADCSDLG
jgi:hypothetical protein